MKRIKYSDDKRELPKGDYVLPVELDSVWLERGNRTVRVWGSPEDRKLYIEVCVTGHEDEDPVAELTIHYEEDPIDPTDEPT